MLSESAGRSGAEQGGQSQDGATTEREGYTVYRGKEAWAEELFRACRRLGLPPDRAGRPNLRALSKKHLGLGPSTLIARIGSPGDPELETLRLLERHAGLPRLRSLLALGEITRADLEAELGVAAADLPPELVAAWAGIMAAAPHLPREWLLRLVALLLELTAPHPADNSHGPSPTAGGR